MMRNKKAKSKAMNGAIWVLIVLGIVVLGSVAINMFAPNFGNSVGIKSGTTTETPLALASCPDTGLTAFNMEVFNNANDTGREGYDVTAYVFQKTENGEALFTTITDTTSPSDVNIECNRDYVVKVIGTDGASGDSSEIISFAGGAGTGASVVDGNLEFKATGATAYFDTYMNQHATLNCRAYDNVAKGLIYDSADASNSDYEADGVLWKSTTSNTSKYDETAGIDVEFECKAIQTDTDYNDRGVLILIEAPVAEYQDPVVKVNGQTLSDYTDSMTSDERKTYDSYEYAFLIPSDVVMRDGGQGFKVDFAMELLDGVASASTDPQVDFAVRTQSLSTDGSSINIGAVTDASTPAQVIAVYDMSIDVT